MTASLVRRAIFSRLKTCFNVVLRFQLRSPLNYLCIYEMRCRIHGKMAKQFNLTRVTDGWMERCLVMSFSQPSVGR